MSFNSSSKSDDFETEQPTSDDLETMEQKARELQQHIEQQQMMMRKMRERKLKKEQKLEKQKVDVKKMGNNKDKKEEGSEESEEEEEQQQQKKKGDKPQIQAEPHKPKEKLGAKTQGTGNPKSAPVPATLKTQQTEPQKAGTGNKETRKEERQGLGSDRNEKPVDKAGQTANSQGTRLPKEKDGKTDKVAKTTAEPTPIKSSGRKNELGKDGHEIEQPTRDKLETMERQAREQQQHIEQQQQIMRKMREKKIKKKRKLQKQKADVKRMGNDGDEEESEQSEKSKEPEKSEKSEESEEQQQQQQKQEQEKIHIQAEPHEPKEKWGDKTQGIGNQRSAPVAESKATENIRKDKEATGKQETAKPVDNAGQTAKSQGTGLPKEKDGNSDEVAETTTEPTAIKSHGMENTRERHEFGEDGQSDKDKAGKAAETTKKPVATKNQRMENPRTEQRHGTAKAADQMEQTAESQGTGLPKEKRRFEGSGRRNSSSFHYRSRNTDRGSQNKGKTRKSESFEGPRTSVSIGGTPLLPGTSAYAACQAEKRRHRQRLAEMAPKVETRPAPYIVVRREIDLVEMEDRALRDAWRERDNRYLINAIASRYASPALVDSVNERRSVGSGQHADERLGVLEGQTKENMLIATSIRKASSEYDAREMAQEWMEKREHRLALRRYDPRQWEEIFAQRKRAQELRGRELNPHYQFQFN